MATLAPIAVLNDNGRGVSDIQAALAQAADLTNDFFNAGDAILVVDNQTVGSITVTLKSQPDDMGRGGTADTNNDEVLTIPTLKTGFFPFLNPRGWNGGGKAQFTLSSVAAGVKIGVWRMQKLR